ncbi:hypothetical protein [Nocardia jejuensis]|uniref:hypothetical protein n=1 Tax=Nocardia jejuensis TaxID=328049 RepID=UPI00082B670F|nr:hypothetical protein [Nocardia jejuensis]
MRLRLLGKGGSGKDDCPSLFATDGDTFIVQGWRTDNPNEVEIPHLLTGFAEPRTYLGVPLTDTGRGTFTLVGTPIVDVATLDQLTLESYEVAVEVPRGERTYFGGVPADS